MNTPSTRMRKITALAAGPIAVLLAGGLVWQASQAAFTATTRNAGNAWSSGQVALTDDDNGVAAFTVANILPQQTGQKCIVVTSKSTVPGVVKAYVQNLSTSAQGLEQHIILNVESGTGGSFDSCNGFTPTPSPDAHGPMSLAMLATVNKDYASGGIAWATAGTPGETKTYRGTWTFETADMTQQQIDALQGATTSIDLVWELQTAADPAPTTP